MNRARLNIWLRRGHYVLALLVGAQVVLWFVSGLFMALFPIETVRGDHLRRAAAPTPLVWSADWPSPAVILAATEARGAAAHRITLTLLDGAPAWRLETAAGPALLDAATGARLDPISEDHARRLAAGVYAGTGAITAATFFLEAPPREYGRDGPAWRLDFGPADAASLYVDAATGEVRPVRTALWRAFDLMWGLHIMDWGARDNFNSWWIKLAASLALLLALGGVGIAALRLFRARPGR